MGQYGLNKIKENGGAFETDKDTPQNDYMNWAKAKQAAIDAARNGESTILANPFGRIGTEIDAAAADWRMADPEIRSQQKNGSPWDKDFMAMDDYRDALYDKEIEAAKLGQGESALWRRLKTKGY